MFRERRIRRLAAQDIGAAQPVIMNAPRRSVAETLRYIRVQRRAEVVS